jgi:hypothetical protein
MSEPDEPDEISREIDAVFAQFYSAPTEADLRGVDPATFSMGICYGFATWQEVRAVANNRRNVANAARYWSGQHPTRDFLSHAVGSDESAIGHRRLLDLAHPHCDQCAEQLAELSGNQPELVPAAHFDDLDLEWLLFQPVQVTRSEPAARDVSRPLHIDRGDGQPITAEHHGDGDWRITIRHLTARQATVWIEWTTNQITEHSAVFENDLADIDAEAPEPGAGPKRVKIMITDEPSAQ